MPITTPAPIPTRQEVSRDAASPCRRRGGTAATQIATTATSSATINTTVPTLRQSVSRTSDADNDSTSSEADISRINRSGGGSSSRGEGGKYVDHTTRTPPTATPIAAPGQQTCSATPPTLLKSVLQVFLGSAAREILPCEATP